MKLHIKSVEDDYLNIISLVLGCKLLDQDLGEYGVKPIQIQNIKLFLVLTYTLLFW